MSLLETFALSVWCSKQLYTYSTWVTLTYSLSDNLVMTMKLSYWNFHGNLYAAAAAKSLQSWPTLCDPIDGSPPGSPVPGVLQARTLEWVVISFSNAWKWKVKVKSLSHVRPSEPMDCSPPGSSIHGIFKARVLEWGAIALYGKFIEYDLNTETHLLRLIQNQSTGYKRKLQVMEIPTNISLEFSWMYQIIYKAFRVLKVMRTLYIVLKSRETSGEWLAYPIQPDSESRRRWRDRTLLATMPARPQTGAMPAHTPLPACGPALSLSVRAVTSQAGTWDSLAVARSLRRSQQAHTSLSFALLSDYLLRFAPLYLMPRSRLWQTRSFWKELWSFMLPRPLPI